MVENDLMSPESTQSVEPWRTAIIPLCDALGHSSSFFSLRFQPLVSQKTFLWHIQSHGVSL